MASFNRVILMGNLTRDPVLRHIPTGTAVTDIALAVNDRRKNNAGEWVDETTFVDITLWGRTAEVAAEYLTKGAPALIEGRLKLDTWESEGQKRSKLKVIGEKMSMIGGGGGGAASRRTEDDGYSRESYGRENYGKATSRSQQQAPQQDYYDSSPMDDDPPF